MFIIYLLYLHVFVPGIFSYILKSQRGVAVYFKSLWEILIHKYSILQLSLPKKEVYHGLSIVSGFFYIIFLFWGFSFFFLWLLFLDSDTTWNIRIKAVLKQKKDMTWMYFTYGHIMQWWDYIWILQRCAPLIVGYSQGVAIRMLWPSSSPGFSMESSHNSKSLLTVINI